MSLSWSSLLAMYRAHPVEGLLCTVLPVSLAVVQLANSAFNDLSFLVSVPFAFVIVGYALLLNQFAFARFRRRELERELCG